MNRRKILVIDDDTDIIESTEIALTNENYEVITSRNGKKALEILNSDEDIQVLLIDLSMPDFSGVDFLKEIKNFKRHIHRIVFTGHQKMLDDQEAEDFNIFAYLEKGGGSNSLLFTIKYAFDDIELQEARQWKDLAFITTETVHLIGNKISPIRRRIDEIATVIVKLNSEMKIDKDDFDKIMRDIEIIKDGVEQAHSIKSDLIDGSVRKRPINIIDVLNEVIIKSKAEYKYQIILHYDNQKSYIIIADENIIRRVFDYLIKNAVQSIEDKNTFPVNHKIQITGKITITLYVDDNQFCIDFEDNGCGIEVQDIGKIFKPFFTTKGADRGSGVGLYFCKRIMEDLGGDIKIKKTQVGIGTTISLKFPLTSTKSID